MTSPLEHGRLIRDWVICLWVCSLAQVLLGELGTWGASDLFEKMIVQILPTIEYASMEPSYPYPISLKRLIRAVKKVRIRLLRAVKVLEDALVPYAVIGGNAVAAWVSFHPRLEFANQRSSK